MISNVEVFGAAGKQLVEKTLKSGAQVVGLMGRKAYGEATGKKGKELKRAHYDYLMLAGADGSSKAAGLLGSGEWIVPKMKSVNGDKVELTLIRKTAIEAPDARTERARQEELVRAGVAAKIREQAKLLGLTEEQVKSLVGE